MRAALEERALRVLIIDTDSVRRGMLACTLPAARFNLEFARSLEKGLDLLGQLQPDVVIVGRDSAAREVCQRVRSLAAGQSCTLILMDEQYRNESAGEAEAEAAGADTFLPFPFEAPLFEQRLEMRKRTPTGANLSIRTTAPTAEASPAPAARTPTGSAESTTRAWDSFRGRVETLYGKLDAVDYFELLELRRPAGPGEIKDAYFKCSMELHPDRFVQLPDEELKRKIYEVYKRMSEAFKVLINSELRSAYEAGLDGTERAANLRYLDRGRQLASFEDPTSDAATPAGKRYLHFANLAASEGNLRSTRMYLTLALQCEPQNGALRARLDEVTRRLEA
jgi:CheY-like chemotaxis protein